MNVAKSYRMRKSAPARRAARGRHLIVAALACALLAAAGARGEDAHKPFTEKQIVYGLVNYIPPPRLAELIAQRGVDFRLTSDIENQIRLAGGNQDVDAVIAAIRKWNLAHAAHPTTPAEAAAGAMLQVRSSPGGAEVYLDDERQGVTSPEGVLIVPRIGPGEHRVRVAAAGYAQWEKALTFSAGQETSVVVILNKGANGTPSSTQTAKTTTAKTSAADAEFVALKKQFGRGQDLYHAKQYAQAATAFQQALPFAHGENRKVVLARLARSYEKAKQYDRAIPAYQQAIAADPTNANLVNNLGSVYSHSGKDAEAENEFEKAAQIDPSHAAMYYFNLGAVYYSDRKMREADAALQKSVHADPKYATSYYWLAQARIARIRMGQDGKLIVPAGTRRALETYLKLAPNGPKAPRARTLLKKLPAQ